MNFHLSKQGGKIKVLTVPMPSLESATVSVWVKTGSRNEEDRISGLSHFLEHMVFKGSKKRPSAAAISKAIDSIGAEANAATSKEWTNFYLKTKTESIENAFDILSDMVFHPILNPKEIEKEKKVILQEIAMYEDTPIHQIDEIFERILFSGSRLARDVIGKEETVKEIRKNDFLSYRNIYYVPENILVSVAGGVSEKKVLELTRKYFSGIKISGFSKEEGFKKGFISNQTKPRVLLKKKENEQAHLILGFQGYERDFKEKFTEAVVNSILGGGMSSRMFTEIREKKGLAYAVRVYSEHYSDTGEFATYVGVDPKKAEETIKVMLDQYYGLAEKKYKVEKEELKKAKEYLKGQLALFLEDTKNVSYFFGERALFGLKLKTPDQVFDLLDKVTLDEVYEYAKKTFVPEKLNLGIIGPFKEKEPFEKIIS